MSAIQALAVYVSRYENDLGGSHLRSALLAAILADRYGLDEARAVDVARGYDDDPRVREAGNERDRLIEQARRAALAADMGEAVSA